MTPFDVEGELKTAVVLVDTREQDTLRARRRLHEINLPIQRTALSFGDYSIKCNALDLSNSIAIERKMDLTELCNCFCSGRDRFTKEFQRCREKNAKLYLLVENGSWEKVLSGAYRSKMSPESLRASILAWLARYNCQIIFCEAKNSGILIREILLRELRERLICSIDELTDQNTKEGS